MGVSCHLHNTLRELDAPRPELCCDVASLAVVADEDYANASDVSVAAAGDTAGHVTVASALVLGSTPDRSGAAADLLWSPGR